MFSFCLCFFPSLEVVNLRLEVISFKQKEKESLGTSWERFKNLINTGPDFAIQDPILIQHFYMGLNKETLKFLDIASGGLFLHVNANLGRSILDKILENTPFPEEVEKELPKEESQIAEPKFLSNPSQILA